MNIGEAIRKFRKEKDMKAETIYAKLEISQSTYSKIENNKYKIDINTLRDIAAILDIDVVRLIKSEKSYNISPVAEKSNNTHSDKLIQALENQIELLKEQNLTYKETIKVQQGEITALLKDGCKCKVLQV